MEYTSEELDKVRTEASEASVEVRKLESQLERATALRDAKQQMARAIELSMKSEALGEDYRTSSEITHEISCQRIDADYELRKLYVNNPTQSKWGLYEAVRQIEDLLEENPLIYTPNLKTQLIIDDTGLELNTLNCILYDGGVELLVDIVKKNLLSQPVI